MNGTLAKGLLALFPAGLLFLGAVVLVLRTRTLASLLQLLGAGCLLVVVLTHVAEGLGWFRAMRWGQDGSAGHYLDLASAGLAITLFPLGYVIHVLRS